MAENDRKEYSGEDDEGPTYRVVHVSSESRVGWDGGVHHSISKRVIGSGMNIFEAEKLSFRCLYPTRIEREYKRR